VLIEGQGRRQCQRHGADHDGKREHQRPGDDLPATEPARQPGPFGVTQSADHDGCQHQAIADRRGLQALHQCEARDQRATEDGKGPEGGLGPLSGAERAENGGGERQQADEDDGMRGGHVPERERGQERKADNHAAGDDGERQEIRAGRTPFPECHQQADREQAGDGGAGDGEKDRIEFGHGQPGGGQRAGKDHHADEAVDPTSCGLVHAFLQGRRGALACLRFG
jgi:hypothetical protein